MLGILELPTLAQQAVEQLRAIAAPESKRRYVAEYLTRAPVAEKKTVWGITAQFIQTPAPSCCNCWSAGVDWKAVVLYPQRLRNFYLLRLAHELPRDAPADDTREPTKEEHLMAP